MQHTASSSSEPTNHRPRGDAAQPARGTLPPARCSIHPRTFLRRAEAARAAAARKDDVLYGLSHSGPLRLPERDVSAPHTLPGAATTISRRQSRMTVTVTTLYSPVRQAPGKRRSPAPRSPGPRGAAPRAADRPRGERGLSRRRHRRAAPKARGGTRPAAAQMLLFGQRSSCLHRD